MSTRNVPREAHGRLLHFVLTPIFSVHQRFFLREIARLSGLTVIFYRLHHEDERASVSLHSAANACDSRERRFPFLRKSRPRTSLLPSSYLLPIIAVEMFLFGYRKINALAVAAAVSEYNVSGEKLRERKRIERASLRLFVSDVSDRKCAKAEILTYDSPRRLQARKHPLVSCLNDMIPVNPRRVEYRFPDILENVDNREDGRSEKESDDEEDETFSLFVTTPRLTMIPCTIIDTKIVVVGASDCGVAFAEYLVLR